MAELLEYLIQVHGGAVAAAQVGAVSKEFKALAVSEKEAGVAGVTAGAGAGKLAGLAGKGLLAAAAGIAAVGLQSVKMSNTFNTEMLKIRTEGGASSKEFRNMRKGVLDLATSGASMGQGPTSLAQGLYHLESMGLRGSTALMALKLASEEAAISGAHLEDTTTAIGGALFVAMKGTGNLTQMMSTLNAIAGSGNMRFQQLNEALGTGLLSSAKLAGLSLQETGAALAVLTDSGMNASSAAAQMATALHFLYNPSAKAQGALKSIGLTGAQLAADLHKPQGLSAALGDLRDHLKRLGQTQKEQVLGDILPGGRGRVLLSLLTMLDRVQQKYKQINDTAGGIGTTHSHSMAGHGGPQAVGGPTGFAKHVLEQAQNPATKLATAASKLSGHMVKLGDVLTKYVTPALIWLENAGSKVLVWAVKAIPEMAKLTRQGFGQLASVGRTVWHVLVQIGNACTTFGQWLIDGGKAIAGFVSGGLKMFIKGWQQLLQVIQPVVDAIKTVTNLLPSLQLPSLPGSGVTVTGSGTAAQRRQFNHALGSVGITPPAAPRAPSRGSQGIPPVITHGVYNGPDLNIHIGGHHFAKITRREIQKAMMAGA